MPEKERFSVEFYLQRLNSTKVFAPSDWKYGIRKKEIPEKVGPRKGWTQIICRKANGLKKFRKVKNFQIIESSGIFW
jgi:hypothetical protein